MMLSLVPNLGPEEPLRVLCFGAHADDLEIGCSGTLLDLVARHPNTHIHWVVLSACGVRRNEAAAAAERVLAHAKQKTIVLGEFRDGYFPYQGADIKDFFEERKQDFAPDLIFTHYRRDLHQDHRLISDLTWNTYRNHLILEYEIPKYDGDTGSPNVFVPLSAQIAEAKIATILDSFASQRDRYWFTADTFQAMLRLRGVEARSATGLAEGFYAHKLTLGSHKGSA
jgi:LmbE family N-acetylglucosaminyl deacetylase